MEEIKIGIIGMGRMGVTHYAILNSRPDVRIVSVSDTSKAVLNVCHKLNSELDIHVDYRRMLTKTPLDGVVVCTPPVLHYDVCKTACENGIAVFCEKPFTVNTGQARELTEMFRAAGLVNQIGYVNRFNDVFLKSREFVRAGLLGKITRLKSEMFSATVVRPVSGGGWRSKHATGGGCVFEMASHAIDLVNYLLGGSAKVFGAAMSSIYSKTVEDTVTTALLYDDGKFGTVDVNWCDTSYRKPCNKIEIFGTGGKLLADQYGLRIFMNEPNGSFGLHKGWNTFSITDLFRPVPFYVRGNEFTAQLYHFADAIQARAPETLCGFADGLAVHEIIQQIFEFSGSVPVNKA